MKSTLEFDLPEEKDELFMALNGYKYSIVLDDLSNWLRGMSKYQDLETVAIEEVRTKIRELMEERDLYE